MSSYRVEEWHSSDRFGGTVRARESGHLGDAHGGELVAIDVAAETIEGKPPGPQTVILKFDSVEKVKEWYNSPDYQKVVGKRLAATEGFAVISQEMNMG